MSKNQIQEFEKEYQALGGEDFETEEVKLKRGQKDFSNLVIGEYRFLYPVLIDKYTSITPILGWLCQNTTNNKYRLITNLAANKMYLNYKSNSYYLGLEYVEEDCLCKRLEAKEFEKEFLKESEYLPTNYDFEREFKHECLFETHIFVDNITSNLKYFKSLNKKNFDDELSKIVNKYHFVPIDDMSSYKNCLYLAVLDDYNQFYVGKCVGSLKNRMRKHWTAKVIPDRQKGWRNFKYSKIKYDNFKMFDTTRLFVCTEIEKILEENKAEACNPNLECDNTFGLTYFECMTQLDKAERIVINNSKCVFTLSDRPPLMTYRGYDKLSKRYHVNKKDLLIKHFLELDKYVVPERSEYALRYIERHKPKSK